MLTYVVCTLRFLVTTRLGRTKNTAPSCRTVVNVFAYRILLRVLFRDLCVVERLKMLEYLYVHSAFSTFGALTSRKTPPQSCRTIEVKAEFEFQFL